MDLLQYIENNPAALDGETSLRALLSDIFQNDRAKVNLLLTAYRVGILREMEKTFPLPTNEKNRIIKILVEQYSIVDKRAAWAVDTWMTAITEKALHGLAAFRLAREQELLLALEQTQEKEDATEEETLLPDGELAVREDFEDYYINPTLTEEKDRIYIPCGVGKTDRGFFIRGIKRTDMCQSKDGDVYALVYNLLVRKTVMESEDIPRYIKEKATVYATDYQPIFRLAVLLLQMIRHNYLQKGTLILNYKGDKEPLKRAVGLICHYAALFCRLMHIPAVKFSVTLDPKGHPVSLKGEEGIWIEPNTSLRSPARELWYGRKICYAFTKEDRADLETLLGEISPYDSFIDGQFDALRSMLSASGHSMTIMPTGSGKSLLYYLASFLQPLPLLVVAPTDILIRDQLRNLKATHRIDNVAHLTLTEDNSFADFSLHASLNYITPMTLQNRHLLVKFRYINEGTARKEGDRERRLAPGPLLAYVVLDEIHCLSNWGHDFRPEYRMLSKFLGKYLDKITLWGFTATANYTVVEDIERQLRIPEENIFSPISFERYNVSYDFRKCKTTKEMYKAVGDIAASLIARGQRTVIFTKNDDVSRRVADVVGWEADVLTSDDPTAYHHFVDGLCKVLVAGMEFGVGINLPEVHHVIHFGLPLSKSEYVQEIGRAGRGNGQAFSYVIFLEQEGNAPKELLDRSTKISDIPAFTKGLNNDFAHIYRALTNHCPTKEILRDRLLAFYTSLASENRGLYLKSFSFDTLDDAKQQMFMLYTVGYINDWYAYGESRAGKGVDVMIDVCSTDTDAYRRDPQKMLLRMKRRLRDYFAFLGNDREGIVKTDRAKTGEEVIGVFVEWYYDKYLYRHSESFLDLYEFILRHEHSDNHAVTADIKDHFTLPFIKLKSDEVYYGEMSLSEIANKVQTGIDAGALANIERINSNRYSHKLDFLLFCGRLLTKGIFEESRLRRVLQNTPKPDHPTVTGALSGLYPLCPVEGKLATLRFLKEKGNSLGIDYETFLATAYANGAKDAIYYGIMAKQANRHFQHHRR